MFQQLPIELLSQLGYRWMGEKGFQRKLNWEALSYPTDDAGSQQRMPAELEEVVVYADALDLKHVGPNLRQLHFERRGGWRVL